MAPPSPGAGPEGGPPPAPRPVPCLPPVPAEPPAPPRPYRHLRRADVTRPPPGSGRGAGRRGRPRPGPAPGPGAVLERGTALLGRGAGACRSRAAAACSLRAAYTPLLVGCTRPFAGCVSRGSSAQPKHGSAERGAAVTPRTSSHRCLMAMQSDRIRGLPQPFMRRLSHPTFSCDKLKL